MQTQRLPLSRNLVYHETA